MAYRPIPRQPEKAYTPPSAYADIKEPTRSIPRSSGGSAKVFSREGRAPIAGLSHATPKIERQATHYLDDAGFIQKTTQEKKS